MALTWSLNFENSRIYWIFEQWILLKLKNKIWM